MILNKAQRATLPHIYLELFAVTGRLTSVHGLRARSSRAGVRFQLRNMNPSVVYRVSPMNHCLNSLYLSITSGVLDISISENLKRKYCSLWNLGKRNFVFLI